jgi:hypothetical protein
MKFKNYFFLCLLAMAVFVTGCVKSINQTNPAVVIPTGNFTGKFAYIHARTSGAPMDTVISVLNLTLSTSGTYAVTGDTSRHAGSFGSFGADGTYMAFADKTYPVSKAPTKIHLSGSYLYSYDGTTLKLLAVPSDTVSYQYQFTKSN